MQPRIFHLVAFAAIAVSSCAANSGQPSELTSTDRVIQALKDQGATVMGAGALPLAAYPFFSAAAQRILVNGPDVQVFEYANTTRADADAPNISPTGSRIGQSQISWMDTPSFYKRDRLIVLYVGHSADVMKSLESAGLRQYPRCGANSRTRDRRPRRRVAFYDIDD
jgi:hypothetical protein